MPTTALVLAIIQTQADLVKVLIASQTPDQQKIMWDRYIELTEPLHKLIVKLENLGS